MNLLISILFVAGLVVSVAVGWRFRSIFLFLSTLVVVLCGLAVLEERMSESTSDSLMFAERAHSRAADREPQLTTDMFVSSDIEWTPAKLEAFRPVEVTTHGYVGSDACRQCHPNNHATWESSYHRTMTQVADPEIVMGDFDNVTIRNKGRDYYFTQSNGVCMVDMPDEHDSRKRVRAPVVMTTGSHHMQVYWFATGQRRLIGMLPLVYLRESQEWVPRDAAFLLPPNHPPTFELGRWNETCSGCHSTHRKGRRLGSGEWDTHVGEFGISCEACHGPAESHIAYHRGSDQTELGANVASDPIVNPTDLPKERAAQVCGQCHSVIAPLSFDLYYKAGGHKYRPGDDLTKTHRIWNRDSPEYKNFVGDLEYPDLDTLLNETFYPDGMIRVSGREYNGLIESACYIDGEMTCFTCHQLHQSESDDRPIAEWANDQLSPDALHDQACVQCHDAERYSTSHTHHKIDSSGSVCYNCHMPHTAYGLLKSIRNHQISSPDVAKDRAAQRPNACNLCHLDQTLQWSADNLNRWFGIAPPELDKDERAVAASLIWLLRGNAAERAISAWHMGWDEAKRASGDDWQLPFLAELLDDQYEAVRLIARKSIQSLEETSDFSMDVVTSSTSVERQERRLELIQRWWATQTDKQIARPTLLLDANNRLQLDRVRELLERRDHTPISLSE